MEFDGFFAEYRDVKMHAIGRSIHL